MAKEKTEKKKAEHKFISGLDLIDKEEKVISISPAYDLNMGGGLREGTWNLFSGAPKCGKTTAIIHMCGKIQQAKPNSKVFWADIENRLGKRAVKSKVLDLNRFQVIRSTKEKYLYAEDYLQILEDIIMNEDEATIVVDSVSALCTFDIAQAAYDENPMTTKANILVARFVKKMTPILAVKNHIFIGVNQMMANPSGYGAGMKEKGVTALFFQADNRLVCKKVESIEKDGKVIGQTALWKIEATCLEGAETNNTFESVIYYGRGINEELELLRLAITFGVVEKRGSWFNYEEKFDSGETIEHKWQGEQSTLEALEANPELMAKLKDEVDRTIN